MKLSEFIKQQVKVNINSWKRYKVTDLFTYEKGKDSSPTENEKQMQEGVLCATAKNNNSGYGGYKLEANKIFSGTKLILVAQGDGGAGMCFVSDEDCCANGCVYILKPKFDMNKNIGLFIATIISKNKNNFNHEKGINNQYLEDLNIILPSDEDGNPDLAYMNNFVAERDSKENLEKILNNSISKTKLNTSSWKEFSITCPPFNLYSSNSTLDKNKIVNLGLSEFNYVTRTDNMNGILFKIPRQNNSNLNEPECLTIGLDTQTVFYQSDPFYTGQNVHILRVEGASKNSYLYIATILKKVLSSHFYWGNNGATLGRLKEIKIKFPCTADGKLDFEYMEEYIKSLKANTLI